MEHIYIDMREQGFTLSRHFKNKDMVSVEDVLKELEQVIDDLEDEKEKFKEYQRDVEDNCRPIPMSEHLGIDDRDFYEDR